VMDSKRGEYYLSQFGDLPDLNLTNENVIAEFKGVINYLAGLGVNGFHINDMEQLTENTTASGANTGGKYTRNVAGNADVIDSLRKIVNGLDNKPGREKLLTGTVTDANADQIRMYYGGKDKLGLHIVSVVDDALLLNIKDHKTGDLENILEGYMNITADHWLGWRWSTSGPGSSRLFNGVSKDEASVTVAHALQALLPGSSMPYYGDEIAMSDGVDAMMKTVTPMQWSKDSNAGFTSGTPWLAVDPDFSTKNVDSKTAQLGKDKMMDSFKALNELRQSESLQFGKTMFCSSGPLLIFARKAHRFDSFVVAINLDSSSTTHKFKGDACVGDRTTGELVFHSQKQEVSEIDFTKSVRIGANEVLVFKLPA